MKKQSNLSKAMAQLSRDRWKKTPFKERQKISQLMHAARWGKKTKTKKKK